LIGPATTIKGELASADNLQIEGKVEGKVKGDKQVVIGEKGQVQAEVEAVVVSIRGKLQGDCVATDKVEITSTGKVFGNISAPRISVVEGAIFRGASSMTSEQKQSEPKPSGSPKPEPAKKPVESKQGEIPSSGNPPKN
jgi:cytoskeletal protein CcmA (bactofilin family)